MGTFETYSKRQNRLSNQGIPDVYQYDILPAPFRHQVVHILRDALGPDENAVWISIHSMAAREFGLPELFLIGDDHEKCAQFLTTASVSDVLDLIDLAFHEIDTVLRRVPQAAKDAVEITLDPDEAIAELNQRFREHYIGFEFAGGQLLKKDSQFLHSEVTVPALRLLSAAGFAGPNEEFLKAHDHYLHGRYDDCNVNALKAFESIMKVICDQRKWSYPPGATALKLIEAILSNGLIPSHLQSELTGLRTMLESGVPTLRNRSGGHGQGSTRTPVPEYIAAFALNSTAANIVLLVEAHKAMR